MIGAVSTSPARELLARTTAVMDGAAALPTASGFRVGVDLGTAYTVVLVTDGAGAPLAGAYEFGRVTRDGVVLDFRGAIDIVRRLRERVEARLGVELTHAASGYPPGVARAEVRAIEHVLDGAGLACTALVDEPTAANEVLNLRDGAVVDIGGGTTGIAVLSDGQIVSVADEPTGGTQATLVVAGGLGISIGEAEAVKRDPDRFGDVAPLLRPVWEKIGSIVAGAIAAHHVPVIKLVGGTSRFPGIDAVIESVTGVRTHVPGDPLFVTALGLAYCDAVETGEGT
jgi:ethanolamine utilization protein EutJ